MKKNPYANSTGIIQDTDTCGKSAISAAEASSRTVSQRIRLRSLRWPKSGLLMAEAAKMPDSTRPVEPESKLRAFWRNREEAVPMALPAKSRRLKAKLVAGRTTTGPPSGTIVLESQE